MMSWRCAYTVTLALIGVRALAAHGLASAATLEVGPGSPFARIEEANAKAQPGDVILVYARADGQPYEKTAVLVRQKGLTFRGVPGKGGGRVLVSGKGFSYSGVGSTPRAIFQFGPRVDGCVLEGFELTAAHNHSHNGAGVRIHQANHVTIRNCEIHHNDMGIMSNGDGTPAMGVDQRIQQCQIHHNGDPSEPGYNHNLYLGGSSVTLSFCEIHSSLTGHNVKSRAHHTRIEYCYLHDSANRECDLVDAVDTARPESHAVLLGNIIVKDSRCQGNRGVIHFGQDGGKPHDGTLYLHFNTIVTPFTAPIIDLSAVGAKARLLGNLVSDGGAGQAHQQIASARNGAQRQDVSGEWNWLSGGFSNPGSGLTPETNRFERAAVPLFINPAQHNYRLTKQAAELAATGLSPAKIDLPRVPGMSEAAAKPPLIWQYRHPAGRENRPLGKGLTRGAYGHASEVERLR